MLICFIKAQNLLKAYLENTSKHVRLKAVVTDLVNKNVAYTHETDVCL